ncbi:phosphatidylinositol-3-phosphatase ymr1 [Coemansia sp. RSA 1813]|nr:phosphatidylinositol-3-phosphatase ymr1 [Coemansia sp. RSA 1646]KAJ1767401.1 phosphatidylinositol-3-phosphatase ymr1 [Coemansia sp. RSA 1843]KAJ2087964.1 phosphatidylinositol-3-phosphatase ymr1 [Coemansia sp. RSA 986]KAJ2211269.1 phosphatidylinositol-3-phosphatase ymr1 [Coemansia sp. RSA 487]KAJ2567802.1 phosphatidylinositol-3-phosphatase ymr1 [Coemansia sp. RSA 1813]
MDLIRVTKVEGMRLVRTSADEDTDREYIGTLHLTTHHLIFTAPEHLELWLGYPLIHSAELVRPPKLFPKQHPYTREELVQWGLEGCINVRCQHFLFFTLRCDDVRKLYDVFATMKQLATVRSVKQLYAFDYAPHPEFDDQVGSHGLYNPKEEFARMGVGRSEEVGKFWRFSDINRTYQLCPTYPPLLVVPAKISDTTLTYAAKHRSKSRLPVLCYLHPNNASMTRSSQPMVGLKQARSVQDEKLVEAILATSEPQGVAPRFGTERNNIIIDARPTTNAVVNRAVGAGSENMDHYKRCRKEYLGIDNIHVMRDALNKMVDAMQAAEQQYSSGAERPRGVVARIQGSKTNWLRHVENIMVGVRSIVEAIDAGNHVLVHCSDGWDRTAQLTSLAQLCLDPYYRTTKGFAVLIEKEWVSFGHQFSLRCGHTGHSDKFKVSRAKTTSKTSSDDNNNNTAASDDNTSTSGEGDESDILQTGTSMFGRFASRALRGVQSRISSAIQAASDNLEDEENLDPFVTEYPELQPNYVPPPVTDRSQGGKSSSGGGGFRLGRAKHDHETSPVFQQFLDCVYQIWVQHPTMFEFNEDLLLDLFYHLHSAQFGTFIGNNMKERDSLDFVQNTKSVWSWVWQRMSSDSTMYRNQLYMGGADSRERVIVPDPGYIQYWSALFTCHDPAFKQTSEKPRPTSVDAVAGSEVDDTSSNNNVWASS